MPTEGRVAGLVLAAGTASRMGRNKLLLEVGGESLLRRTARRATEAGLEPVVVVLGHEAERLREELAGLRCRSVLNPDYAGGIHLSVRAGMAALADDADLAAVVVMLADMPFVTPAMVATLVRRHRAEGPPLVISDYEGVNAPPMLYGRALFPELIGLEAGGCGRQVVRRHRAEALVASWPADALADVDLPEDYDLARTRAAASPD